MPGVRLRGDAGRGRDKAGNAPHRDQESLLSVQGQIPGHARGEGQTEQDTQGEPSSAEAAAFISCDNKLPPSVPCTQEAQTVWHTDKHD